MIRKLQPVAIFQLAVVLAIAFALKYFYSTASVNDLRWILAPTAFLVEAWCGMHFTFESHAGYMSNDHTFLIAAPCSGVNFLIISFLMLAVGRLWRERRTPDWKFLPFAALAAYVTTLVANTTRIIVALWLRGLDTTWFDKDELHRIEGIVIYFGFLIALFVVSEKLETAGETTNWESIAYRSRFLLVIYYSVTLGIPILRGSYRETDFREHALFVVVIPFALIIPLFVVAKVKDRYVSRRLEAAGGT